MKRYVEVQEDRSIRLRVGLALLAALIVYGMIEHPEATAQIAGQLFEALSAIGDAVLGMLGSAGSGR